MNIKTILFMLLLMPVMASGMDFTSQRYSDAWIPEFLSNQPHKRNMLMEPVLPIHNTGVNRAWRMQSLVAYQSFDSTLTNTNKFEFFYNSNNPAQIDSIVHFRWNFGQALFYHWNTMIYTYNTNNRCILKTENDYTANTVQPSKRTFYHYENDRLVRIESYQNTINGFQITSRKSYIYGDNYLSASYSSQGLQPSAVTSYNRKIYTTDSYGRVISQDHSDSSDSLNWTPVDYTEITYHPEDTSTGSDYIEYLAQNRETTYWNTDEFYGILNQKDVYVDYTDNSWDYLYRNTYNYDLNLRITDSASLVYYDNELSSNSRVVYVYDTSSNLIQRLMQVWDNSTNDWSSILVGQDYTWEQFTSNDDQVSPGLSFSLVSSPNPFKGSINIRIDSKRNSPVEISVYNVRGQLVKSIDTNTKLTNWDGKDTNGVTISSGIYFIKAEQDGKAVTKKVIKIK